MMDNPFYIKHQNDAFEVWFDNGLQFEPNCFGRYKTKEEAEMRIEEWKIWYEAEIF